MRIRLASLRAVFISVILFITQTLLGQAAAAEQCFSDVNQAYVYLIQQESVMKISSQADRYSNVNINTATEAKLTTLQGIGSRKAQAIILYRDGFGRFDSVDDLTQVKGIGKKTVENNRARLTVQ